MRAMRVLAGKARCAAKAAFSGGVATAGHNRSLTRAAFATCAPGRWVAGQSQASALLPPELTNAVGTCKWTYKTIKYNPGKKAPPPPERLAKPPLDLRRKYVLPPDAVIVEAAYPNAAAARPPHRIADVVPTVHEEMQSRLASADPRLWMFSEKNDDRVRVGDVAVVETWTSVTARLPDFQLLAPMEQRSVAGGMNTASVSRFAGVVVSIRRTGAYSSFVVRNVILGTGTEVRFPIFSPLVKSIRVVQRKVINVPHRRMTRKMTPKWVIEKAKETLNCSFPVNQLYAAAKDKEPFWVCPKWEREDKTPALRA